MNRAFALTLLLIGVVAAVFLLRGGTRRTSAPSPAARDGGLAPSGPATRAPRMVALRRMLPRYALTVSGASSTLGATVLALAEAHGARGHTAVDGGAFVLRIPHAQFKRFLRALRGNADAGTARGVALVAQGERLQDEAEAHIEVTLHLAPR